MKLYHITAKISAVISRCKSVFWLFDLDSRSLSIYWCEIINTHTCIALDILSHLANSGLWASAVTVPITAPPQWSSVPQRTFLLWGIIQNVTVLAALALKSIDIHDGVHGRIVLKAASCPAAAALQWLCGPALPCSQKQMHQAEIHIMW